VSKTLCKLLLVMILLCFAQPAFAQQKNGWPTLSLTGGGYSLGSSADIDGDYTYGVKLGYEINGNSFRDRLGIEAVYLRIDGEENVTKEDVDVTVARLDLLYLFNPLKKAKRIAPFLTVGAGGYFTDGGSETTTAALVAYGMGSKFLLTDSLALRMDLRQLLVFDDGTRTDYEYTLGLTYRFGVEKKPVKQRDITDTDQDGVLDRSDKCPDTPGDLEVDKKGCPVNAPDADGDGVADYLDKCANTPKGLEVDETGCFFDDDGDGVPNEWDRCPSNPPGFQVDENGCTQL